MPRLPLVSRFHLPATVLSLALPLLASPVPAQQAPTAELQIHTDKPVAKVSPTLYGLMTEEINYSYDGGLYAELVRNRVFRDQTFTTDKRDPAHWILVQEGD